jgi:photosystem II stability/assembly factor-like uncharacterized protein
LYSGTEDGVYRSTDGGEIWLHQGLAGAQVNALAIRHDGGYLVFAGTGRPRRSGEATIGVYRSSGGAEWEQVYTDEDDDAVMDLLIDGDDDRYIYAGVMGEDGIAVSDDGGDTWTNNHVSPDEWNDEDVSALAVTPAGAATHALYAFSVALDADVYVSTDHGASWTATGTPEWWMPDYPAALAVDPVDPDVIYVGVTDYHGQLLRSSNGGESWTAIQNGVPEGNPTAIVVDPEDQHVLLAQKEGDIYRSDNWGATWERACSGLFNAAIDDLALHPHDPGTVWASTNGRGHAIAVTGDGGETWSLLPTPPGDVYNADTPAEVSAVAFDPQHPNTRYAADAWGYHDELFLYKSVDGGATWQDHRVLEIVGGSSYIGTSTIWVHPTDSSVVLVAVRGWGGTDGGGVYRSANGGYGWQRPLEVWTNALVSDPNDPDILYAASEQCGYVYRSTDAGQNWANISPATPPGECWVWEVSDLAVDRDGTLLATTSSGLMHWDGAEWTESAEAPLGELTTVALSRTGSPQTVYVGTAADGVFVSRDGGQTWSMHNAGLGARSITELLVTPTLQPRPLAGTAEGGVWMWQLAAPELDHHVWLPLVVRSHE